MRKADIAIVGSGLAGSMAAVMLGRADCKVALIDPHASVRPDFRCEKLDPSQARLFRLMGLSGLVLPFAAHNRELWVARFGRVVDRMPIDQYGILYHDLVQAVRAGIPDRVERLCGTVSEIEASDNRQIVRLREGASVDARLVILANGLNRALQESLGLTYATLSPVHSTVIGFDLVSHDPGGFPFESLTYYGGHPRDRTAYLTVFKIPRGVRANLMSYRQSRDPWLRAIRDTPKPALLETEPGLAAILGDFDIHGPVRVRPADLCVVENPVKAGMVLVGDAFGTSCPAAGTGTNKVLRDIQRLCAVHVPNWLATSGMDIDKIGAFYADAEKRAEDLGSQRAAFRLKTTTLAPGIAGGAQRSARFVGRWAKGAMRRATARLAPRRPSPSGVRLADRPGSTAEIRVETYTGIESLFGDWLELERRCADVTIFQTAHWCRAWIDAARAAGRPEMVRLATVWRADRLVLLWPLAIRRLGQFRIVHALAEPATQYADVLIDSAEDRAALLERVWAAVSAWAGIDAIHLRRVRDGSDLTHLPGLALHAVGSSRASAPMLDFARLAADSAAAARTSRTRNALRRHMRALEKVGPVSFELSDDVEDRCRLAAEAFALKREWQKAKAAPSSGYAHPASEECLLRLARDGQVQVACLRVGTETAAIEIGAQRGGRYWSLVQSYRGQFSKHSPGRLLFWRLLAICPGLSIRVFDFLGPAHAHKLEWSNCEVGICDYVVPTSLRGRAVTSYLAEIKPRLRSAYTRFPAALRNLTARMVHRSS